MIKLTPKGRRGMDDGQIRVLEDLVFVKSTQTRAEIVKNWTYTIWGHLNAVLFSDLSVSRVVFL